jgi:leucine dehydrogenase
MKGFIFDAMEEHDYENVFFCQEKALGLKAIIAIHERANAIVLWQ